MLQGVTERETVSQLLGNEGMHCALQSPTCKQVDTRPLELSRTGSAQDKAQLPLLDEAMYFIKQGRQPLYFVQYYPLPIRYGAQFSGQQSRIRKQTLEGSLREQVDNVGVRKRVPQIRALTHAAWTQKKETSIGCLKQSWNSHLYTLAYIIIVIL